MQEEITDADMPCGRMSQGLSLQIKEGILQEWLKQWLELDLTQSRKRLNGKTQGSHWVKKDCLNGECLTLNTSEQPKNTEDCLLSQILETGEIDPQFLLTPKAALGVLKRIKEKKVNAPQALIETLSAIT